MSLITKSSYFEDHCRSNSIKFRLLESSFEHVEYLVDKMPQLKSILSSVSRYGSNFKVIIKETVGTGAIASGVAGHWTVVPNHPGIDPKSKNLKKKNGRNKKGVFSFLNDQKDANKNHIAGTMNSSGVVETKKRMSQAILESFNNTSHFYNKIKKVIDSYWDSRNPVDLIKNLQENSMVNHPSDDIRLFSRHISDILSGFGLQAVNNSDVDEQDVEFLYQYASKRVA